VSWALSSIPFVLQLAVGVVGLIVTIGTRRRGRGTALLVTAFVLLLAISIGWLVWGFVEVHAPSILADNHLTFDTWQYVAIAVDDVLGAIEVVAWLMVVLGVLRARGGQPAPAAPAPAPFGSPAPFGPGAPAAPGPAGPPGRV
jgi:hypothetical protein